MKNLTGPFLVVTYLVFLSIAARADYGMFMVVKGDVKVQNGNNQANAAKVGLKVAVGDTIISGADSRAKIVMSDRNVISISPSTQIKIEKYQTGANRNVELSLSEGKVRNNVEQEYDGEKTKFLIKTPTAVAGVRGTQFVTSYDVKMKITDVVTLKGQVAFSNLTSSATVLVNKGEQSTMKKDQAPDKPKIAAPEILKSIDHDFSDAKTKSEDPKETNGKKDSSKNGKSIDPKEKSKDAFIDAKDRPTGPSAQDGVVPPPDLHVPDQKGVIQAPPTPKTPPAGKINVIVVPTKPNGT